MHLFLLKEFHFNKIYLLYLYLFYPTPKSFKKKRWPMSQTPPNSAALVEPPPHTHTDTPPFPDSDSWFHFTLNPSYSVWGVPTQLLNKIYNITLFLFPQTILLFKSKLITQKILNQMPFFSCSFLVWKKAGLSKGLLHLKRVEKLPSLKTLYKNFSSSL